MKLADLFIEFTLKGLAGVAPALDGVKAKLENVKAGAEAVGSVATKAFASMTATLGGFVTAGIAASGTGDVLQFRMAELSRTIAGLFRPEIERILDGIQKLTEWFRGLSDEQKENLAHWIKGAVAAAGVAMVMPKVIAGVQGVIAGVRMLTAVFAGLDVATGGILPLIGAAVTAFAALAVGTEVGRGAMSSFWGAVKPIVDALKSVFNALKPVFEVLYTSFAKVLKALQPLFEAVGSLVASLAEALAPVLEIVADIFAVIINLLSPVITFFAQLAKVIVSIVTPVLKALAFVLKEIAAFLKLIFGLKDQKIEVKHDDKTRGALGAKSGFEAVEQAWIRTQQGAASLMGGGKGTAEEQLDVAQKQLAEQERTNEILENSKPPVKR